MRPLRWRRRNTKSFIYLVAGLLLLGVSACNSITFVYQQLDWLIPWYLDDYLTLSAQQQRDFERQLEQLLRWHRKTQLVDYAAWLRELNQDLRRGLTLAKLDAHEQKLRGFWRQLVKRSVPDIAALLATLSDGQIEAMFQAVEKRNREYQDRYSDTDVEKRNRHRVERLQKQLNRWLRQLTAEQLGLLRDWSRNYLSDPSATLAYRRHWQAQLRHALSMRHHPDRFSSALEPLLAEPESLQSNRFKQRRARNLARFKVLLLAILDSMTDSQARYLHAKLDDLANDFTRLAAD